jgi:hypothetical protein
MIWVSGVDWGGRVEEMQDGSSDIISVGGITQHTEAMQSLANTKRSTS